MACTPAALPTVLCNRQSTIAAARPLHAMSSTESDSNEQGVEQDQDWDDWDATGEAADVKALFSDARFASVEEALEHDRSSTGFDLQHFRKQVCHGPGTCVLRLSKQRQVYSDFSLQRHVWAVYRHEHWRSWHGMAW